jgi:hypothetical protein
LIELITQFLKIVFTLAQYFFGKKAEKALRAKEIAEEFKKVTIEGDNLFEQVWEELNRRSQTEWEDIPIRENKENE